MQQQIQDFLDEYCITLGFESYDKSVIEFKVTNNYFQFKLNNNEAIINEFQRFSFVNDLLIGRTFERSVEGLNKLIYTYKPLFDELSFYTEYDNELISFVTK